MITTINKIEFKLNDKGEELMIVKFLFGENQRFTYLTQKSREYWSQKGVKLDEIKVGTKINVFEVPNTKFYKIVSFNEK